MKRIIEPPVCLRLPQNRRSVAGRIDAGAKLLRGQTRDLRHGPDLDRAFLGAGDPCGDVDRLVEIGDLDQEVTAKLFARFGEWAVRYLAFSGCERRSRRTLGVMGKHPDASPAAANHAPVPWTPHGTARALRARRSSPRYR